MIQHFRWTMSFILTLLFLSFMFSSPVFADSSLQDSALQTIPESYRNLVSEVFSTAGTNGDSLAQAVLQLATDEEKEAAAFQLAYLSRVDRVSLSPEMLIDNVRLAVQARHEFPWGKTLSDELFLMQVLPHRVAQEPLQNWRRPFYEALKERVSTCSTATQAALEVNRWCNENATYQATSWRDMGPLTTWKVGLGRCEEEMIFYICAARSVGIPARSCYTPMWGFQDDNHAWVEVYTDGHWHYLGACEPAEALNNAWFTAATQRAALVLSSCYGVPPESATETEPIYRQGTNYTIINSTGVYRDTVALQFQLTFPDGKPADSMNIWAGIFSYGGFQPLARIPTDSNGTGSCVFGATDLMISAGNDSLGVFRILQIRPEMNRNIALQLSKDFLPPQNFHLQHPAKSSPEIAIPTKSIQDSMEAIITNLHNKLRDQGRKVHELEYRAMNPMLDTLSDRFDSKWTKLTEVLNDARGNWQELAKVVAHTESAISPTTIVGDLSAPRGDKGGVIIDARKYLDDLLWLLDNMTQKDRWETPADVLSDHLQYAEMTRKFYKKSVPDSLFRQYVLQFIIDREPPLAWRKMLYETLLPLRKKHLGTTALEINLWLMDHVEEFQEKTPFRNQPTPLQVAEMEGGDKRDLAVLAVGCLRVLGIPARMARGDEWAEWWNGKEFVPLYPLQPDKLGNIKKDAKAEQTYREKGTVALTFTKNDTITTTPAFEKQFSLSRWEQGFYWQDDREGSYQDSTYYLSVEAGDWLFTYGVRKDKEATYIRTIPISVTPKDTLHFTVPINLIEE
jgi:hypothetical protein